MERLIIPNINLGGLIFIELFGVEWGTKDKDSLVPITTYVNRFGQALSTRQHTGSYARLALELILGDRTSNFLVMVALVEGKG
ncbi:hypothetical protein CHS0354_020452 [Potamilus streckersoni]|uniref:Uncharacterized protein n=1 Tax=Potamilus streckersoni TaxID=2493646 RepID=A0AAE0TBW6_9BIVA|nr:hypothetical protein CHS0354_020452 [Potamilus streckersoni]